MKYSVYVLCVALFLSCEEDSIDDLLSDFSDENIPITTIITVETLFESSSVSLNWAGNDFATSFSYKLEPESYIDTVETYTNWSNWDTLNTVTFTNLDDGSYNFYIKSRFTVENEEAVQSIHFIVDAIVGPALRMYPLYQRVTSGENFSMYVYIEDVDSLGGLELHLSYPSNVSASTMTSGTILSSAPIFFDTINSTDGTIELIATAEDFGVSPDSTGTLAKINFTAGEAASLDTLHIKNTSILKNSGNVQIDILERVYGLIEVVE